MFRWVAIVLLLCLPLQWSWAVASPGTAACACTCATAADHDMACGHADAGGDDSTAGCCADCGQGQIPAGLLGGLTTLAHGPADALHGVYRVVIPNPVPERLLRPPPATRG